MIRIKKITFLILISLIFIIKVNAEIRDSLMVTVANKAITKSDIVNEIKMILILNNESYSDDKRKRLTQVAIKSAIKRNIKKIAIEKNSLLKFNKGDLQKELIKLAGNINLDLDTLKMICVTNELDFSLIEDKIRTELLWNSLIFHLYKNRLSINLEEIEEQLKISQDKKELAEYLISEIIIKPVEKNKMEDEIKELKKKIKTEGFEKVAMNLSISKTALKGGDLGWINENIISKEIKSKILSTPIGNLSEPILLQEGILIFKIRDKRKIKKILNMEERKKQLIHHEKVKILDMYSLSHYDSLRRSVAVNFFNE